MVTRKSGVLVDSSTKSNEYITSPKGKIDSRLKQAETTAARSKTFNTPLSQYTENYPPNIIRRLKGLRKKIGNRFPATQGINIDTTSAQLHTNWPGSETRAIMECKDTNRSFQVINEFNMLSAPPTESSKDPNTN